MSQSSPQPIKKNNRDDDNKNESAFSKWLKTSSGRVYLLFAFATFLRLTYCAYQTGNWTTFFVGFFFSIWWPVVWIVILIQQYRLGSKFNFCGKDSSNSILPR